MDVADLVQCRLQVKHNRAMWQNRPSWQCNNSRTAMDKNHPAETSAENVGDGGIGKKIAHLPTQSHFEDEDARCVDDVEDVVVDAVVGEMEETRLEELMLPCMCRMQVLLDRQCNRYQEQPQCPRNRRETE